MVENCFTSVSNGKSAIASAITDKGISTASDATFQIMATNISNIPAGSTVKTGTTAVSGQNGKLSFTCGFKPSGFVVFAWPTITYDTQSCEYNHLFNSGYYNGTEFKITALSCYTNTIVFKGQFTISSDKITLSDTSVTINFGVNSYFDVSESSYNAMWVAWS